MADAGGGATDDEAALSPFLDSFRACYPTKGLFVSEFGFDANRDGPVEVRGTYQFQSAAAAYHLGVFASKPWLSGAMYFMLQDDATSLGYSGGNPWPDPPFDQKGLVDLYGNLKPAFAVVASSDMATVQIAPSPCHGRRASTYTVPPAWAAISPAARTLATGVSAAPAATVIPLRERLIAVARASGCRIAS